MGEATDGRDRLFREWVRSWEEKGQGVPCSQAQADGAPCFELGKDCEECEEAFESWLEFRKEKGIADDSLS